MHFPAGIPIACLLKIIHGVHIMEFLANLQVLYNNFTYSPAQVCL
jgi:hypothetical protein